MKAILTFPACNRRGGVERVLAECANFLASRNHDVSVISSEFDDGVLSPNVHPTLVPCELSNHILRTNAFRRAATRRIKENPIKPPFVHASFGVVCPPDGVLWVQSVHAEWIKMARQHRNWKGRLKQRLNPFHPYVLRLERRYFRGKQYRKLLALTPRIRDELIEHYNVPTQDIVILPNGYNPTEFNSARRVSLRPIVRQELGYGDNDRVLVFVANELERKGFFPLIHAMAAMKDPSLKLLVVGRVSIESHLSLIANLKLDNQVKCIGATPDVGRFYAAADLFVLPTYYEAWGLVIVEALAMGLPVLTSRLAGAAVAVQEGQTGLLLDDPLDSSEIASKLDHLLRASLLSPYAISNTVLPYRWESVLLQYEAILQEHCR